MKKFALNILFCLLLAFPTFAFAGTTYVDCNNGSDSNNSIWSNFLSLQKAVDVVLRDSQSWNNEEIIVKGWCAFGQLLIDQSRNSNTQTFKGSNLVIRSDSDSNLYQIAGPSTAQTIYVNQPNDTMWNIILKNAIISWSSSNGLISVVNWNKFQITDSQINVQRNLLFNNDWWRFEIKNSVLLINQVNASPVRLPAYFHDNIIEDRTRWNRQDWLFWTFSSPIYWNKMWTQNNVFNIYYDLSRDTTVENHYFFAWFNEVWVVKNIFSENKINYLGGGSAIFTNFFNFWTASDRKIIIANNVFSWISKIVTTSSPGGRTYCWYRWGTCWCASSWDISLIAVNNTFDSNIILHSMSESKWVNDCRNIFYDAYNNLNATSWNSDIRKNKNTNDNSWYRIAVDLNWDGVYNSSDYYSDQYCNSWNCSVNQFTLFF